LLAPSLLKDAFQMKNLSIIKRKSARLRWLRDSEGKRVGLILPS
jgi:hypothetical protein